MKDFVGWANRAGVASVPLSHSPTSALLTVGNIGELPALQAAGRQSSSLPAEAQ